MRTADVEIDDQGTIVRFTPLTSAAGEWIAENVETEPYNWLGGSLCVDHRCAGPIIQGMLAAGLDLA